MTPTLIQYPGENNMHKQMRKFKIDFDNDDVDSLIWSYLIEGILFKSVFTKKYLVMTPKECDYFFVSTRLPKESKFVQQKTIVKELVAKFVDSIMYYGYIVIWSMELDQKGGDLQFNLLCIPNQPGVKIDSTIVKTSWKKVSGIQDAELIESFHTNDSKRVKKIVNKMGKQINELNTRKLHRELCYINDKEKCFGTDRDTADYISSVNNIFNYLNLQYPLGVNQKRISTPFLGLPSEKERMEREVEWLFYRDDPTRKREKEILLGKDEEQEDPDIYEDNDYPQDDNYIEDDEENYPLYLYLLASP